MWIVFSADFYAVCAWHHYKSSILYFAFYISLIRVLYFAFCLNLICGSALQNAASGINLNHPIRERRRCQKFMAKASARLGSGIICVHCSICIADVLCCIERHLHCSDVLCCIEHTWKGCAYCSFCIATMRFVALKDIICVHCSICIAAMCFVALNTHVNGIICKQYICIATMYLYCTPQSKRRW